VVALIEGFNKARGDNIIFMDADLSVPLHNIELFAKELKDHDVVIGSRRVKGSNIVAAINSSEGKHGQGVYFAYKIDHGYKPLRLHHADLRVFNN